MIGNYFKISWRNLRQNKAYAFINTLGLSLGIACAILIFSVVTYQLSFDNFHPYADRIFRVISEYHYEEVEYQPGVPQPLGKAFRNDFSFTEAAARVRVYENALITLPDAAGIKKFEEPSIAYADPDFFDIFHFPLAQGNNNGLNKPNTAFITQKLAKKYFGTEDAIGKIIRYDNRSNFVITGILKDIPPNTDRNQEIYLSYDNLKDKSAWLASDSSWGSVSSGMNFFIRLKPGVTQATVEKAFPAFAQKYLDAEDAKATTFLLQPLSNIHFNATLDGYADKKYIWALVFIGSFLIITACVNFINLATAQALNRSKEVGVRKVMGSKPSQLFWQFIAETTVITFFALLVAYTLARLALPGLNSLFDMRMALTFQPTLLLFLLAILLTVVFLSGSYPALILSRFQPVIALKGKLNQKHIGGFSLRRVLVVTQFAISQLLIIGTIVITSQMRYSQTTDPGFHKEAIVLLPIPTSNEANMHTLQARLSQLAGVEKITLCSEAPASESNHFTTIQLENEPKAKPWSINLKHADAQYISVFGLKLVAGRNFFTTDTLHDFLVNETLVKKLGIRSPDEAIGKRIKVNGGFYTAPIAGVLKDFNNQSFHNAIDPICIMPKSNHYDYCALVLRMANAKQVLNAVEKIWNNTYPDYLYKYEFLDERLERFYALDNIMLKLVEGFASIAILIGCLGLYGLVSFMAVQKTKEIGVRKVLGANIANILWLFGKEFSRLLLIAFVIAMPLAWWAMNIYLQDFTYHIQINAVTFALAMLSTFAVAAITVGYRSVRAAMVTPIKSLKAE